MDIFSYLLGKNTAGGGGGGGSSYDWEALGYSGEPYVISDAYNYAKSVKENWNENMYQISDEFSGDYNLIFLPNLKSTRSTATNMKDFCRRCYSLLYGDTLDYPYIENCGTAFYECYSLVKAPYITSTNITTMYGMFWDCINLRDVPIYDTSKVVNFTNMFYHVGSKLTDASLDNILKMCINATSYEGTKTLAQLSFNTYYVPSNKWEGLPSYQNFLNAGWTIGY